MVSLVRATKPWAPRTGCAVGLITPSSSIHGYPRRRERAIRALTELGFQPALSPNAVWRDERKPHPEDLAADITWCCEHEEIDVILCTTGGLSSAEILPHLDYKAILSSRKVLCGFSDITSLLLAVYARTGLVTLHGPTLLPSMGDADGIDPYSARSLLDALVVEAPRVLTAPAFTSSDSPWWDREDHRPRERVASTPWRSLTPGTATGRLVGGHLGTMVSLLGGRHFPETAGCLIFIETNETQVSRIQCELDQLTDAGVWNAAAGILFGRPLMVDRPYDLYEALTRLASENSLPALADIDLGHTVPMLTLPIGITATVDTTAGLLRLDEAAVSCKQGLSA